MIKWDKFIEDPVPIFLLAGVLIIIATAIWDTATL